MLYAAMAIILTKDYEVCYDLESRPALSAET